MALDPQSVGAKGKPARRSWTSKDALLYAVGVGAGTKELQFTTENTKDTPQRVLPTMAVVLGGGGIPFDKVGTFNPALMVHGTEGIELYDEIPPDGELEAVGEITGIWDKGKAAVAEFESTATL
ncbi:enoyl-CoA hydratase, partial [Myxococcota bacterium]|nr:enoyl-CoA hydratase [Myxococcota bacterium]